MLQKIQEYMKNSVDMEAINRKSIDSVVYSRSKVQVLVVPTFRPPAEDAVKEFEEFTFN